MHSSRSLFDIAAQLRPSTAPRGPSRNASDGTFGTELLGLLPSTNGWGFAQAWNRMLHEMRLEDLVSDAEVSNMQFLMVYRPLYTPLPQDNLGKSSALQPDRGVVNAGGQLPHVEPSPSHSSASKTSDRASADASLLPLLIPPPLGSLKRALGLLLGGCDTVALPTLSRTSLTAACDIARALAWPLLGPLHQHDVVIATDAIASILPPIFTIAQAHGPLALPPALRSERVVRGFRKALLALCDAIRELLLSYANETLSAGANAMGAAATDRMSLEPDSFGEIGLAGRCAQPWPAEESAEAITERSASAFGFPGIKSSRQGADIERDDDELMGNGVVVPVQLEGAAMRALNSAGEARAEAGKVIDGGDGKEGNGYNTFPEVSHYLRFSHSSRPSFSTLRGAMRVASASSLAHLRERAIDASAYASVSLRELERIRSQVRRANPGQSLAHDMGYWHIELRAAIKGRGAYLAASTAIYDFYDNVQLTLLICPAQVSLKDLSRLDLKRLQELQSALPFFERTPATATGVRTSDLASHSAALVRSRALPAIQQALASLMACLQHACLAAAADPATPGGGEARKSLRAGAEALQRTLAQARSGFWADEAYADAKLVDLLSNEPHLEVLVGRLRRMLSLSSTETPFRSPEAMRRMRHWLRSLAMDAPAPPMVHQMPSWSILTPVFKEAVLYSLEELGEESNDGCAFLRVLQVRSQRTTLAAHVLHKSRWCPAARFRVLFTGQNAKLGRNAKRVLLALWLLFNGRNAKPVLLGIVLLMAFLCP